jgi:hypothetical protein
MTGRDESGSWLLDDGEGKRTAAARRRRQDKDDDHLRLLPIASVIPHHRYMYVLLTYESSFLSLLGGGYI